MAARHEDTQFSLRINKTLLEQALKRCQEEGLSLSQVIRAAVQDYVQYGMDMQNRPKPPDEEDTARFF